jgi:molybdopterin/thiamine biosynthesis adenylyltransferase
MTHRLHHEQIYRGTSTIAKVQSLRVTICGVGALGSNIAVNLARCGVMHINMIDNDRVEEHNIGTQVFALDDVGALKAEMMQNILYREVGIDVRAQAQELTSKNVERLLKDAQLVIDTFDNSKSREVVTNFCRANNIACLHAGVNNEYGEVVWNENYRVPGDAGVDACNYPLARNLILMVVSVACESIVRFAATGVKENYSMTLGDMSINRESDL